MPPAGGVEVDPLPGRPPCVKDYYDYTDGQGYTERSLNSNAGWNTPPPPCPS